MSEESLITLHKHGGASLVGEDSMRLVRAMTVRAGLNALKVGMQLTRGYNAKRAFADAKEYTGKTYKRGEYDRAVKDMDIWIAEMRAAIPTEDQR